MNFKILDYEKIIFSLGTVLFLSSCSTLQVSTETASVNPSTISEPIQVDINVDSRSKVTGTSKSTYFLNFLRLSGDNQFADGNWKGKGGSTKSAAHYKSLKFSGADVLVNSQYEIKTTNGFLFVRKNKSEFECEIVGLLVPFCGINMTH